MKRLRKNFTMGGEDDVMTYLPSDVIFNILTRLPVATIMSCKCVCKSWLDLLTTREFANSYLSKSVPGLLILERKTPPNPKAFKLIEFADHEDHTNMNIVFNFDLPFNEALRSSVNGLLLSWERYGDLSLCNPITCEYIKLPSRGTPSPFQMDAYGFGVSRMSSQYKVVRILNQAYNNVSKLDQCEVYIVGTGSWKRISSQVPLGYPEFWAGAGVFFNGNLHWLVCREKILCFDLETELFSTLSPPPVDDRVKHRNLSVLGDCLCMCDINIVASSGVFDLGYGSDIWLMKEYGKEKSWTKEFSIRQVMEPSLDYLYPVKVFKDGDILMALGSNKLLYYSSKPQTIRQVDDRDLSGIDSNCFFCSRTFYYPSFLPLKTFTMENVSSF